MTWIHHINWFAAARAATIAGALVWFPWYIHKKLKEKK